MNPSLLAPTSAFAESDFEQLAAALDAVPAAHRELFLTKLVILLTTAAPAGVLPDHIARARLHSGDGPADPGG